MGKPVDIDAFAQQVSLSLHLYHSCHSAYILTYCTGIHIKIVCFHVLAVFNSRSSFPREIYLTQTCSGTLPAYAFLQTVYHWIHLFGPWITLSYTMKSLEKILPILSTPPDFPPFSLEVIAEDLNSQSWRGFASAPVISVYDYLVSNLLWAAPISIIKEVVITISSNKNVFLVLINLNMLLSLMLKISLDV